MLRYNKPLIFFQDDIGIKILEKSYNEDIRKCLSRWIDLSPFRKFWYINKKKKYMPSVSHYIMSIYLSIYLSIYQNLPIRCWNKELSPLLMSQLSSMQTWLPFNKPTDYPSLILQRSRHSHDAQNRESFADDAKLVKKCEISSSGVHCVFCKCDNYTSLL